MAPTEGDADRDAREEEEFRSDEVLDIPTLDCPAEVVLAPSGVTHGIGKLRPKWSLPHPASRMASVS